MDSKYLGIDYGLKRVGISISDNSKKYAFQREHILNDNKLFDKVLELIRIENISKIIIGYPLRFNSEKTHSTDEVEKFRDKLSSLLKKHSLETELIYFDERLTSSLASYNLANSGLSRKKRRDKGLIDSIAAQIILQDYIDSIS